MGVAPQVATTTITCPKCRRPDIEQLIERWDGFVTYYDVPSPGKRYEEGWHEDGTPTGVKAKCKCGHTWMLRNIRQITDLDIPSTKTK
jgi:hypothetical protein